jgi:histidinol phosphatase-like PHP family hydrolase
MDPVRDGTGVFAVSPALCETPYGFLVVTIEGASVRAERHTLAVPKALSLVDTHVHTQFAYCGEDIEVERALALGERFGLAGIVFTEHSDQLYYENAALADGGCIREGLLCEAGRHRRMDAYLDAVAQAGCAPWQIGLETECDHHGHPMVEPADRARAGFLMGSIHETVSSRRPALSAERAGEEFLAAAKRFLASGIRVLGHPFRTFRRYGGPPERLFPELVKLLQANNVAAEINFHHNDPPTEFIRRCLREGVRLSFGSDSHALWEIGEFAPHLQLLRDCGFDGDPADVLIDPRPAQG